MNLGLVTSYIIGGMLMLGIMALSLNMSRSANELTLSHTTGRHVATISEMLSYDITKIGYDLTESIANPIIAADSNRIVFYANIDNTGNAEEIRWEFTNQAITRTENPNDYVLVRRTKVKDTGVDIDKTDITLGVTRFRIRYYSEYGMSEGSEMSTPVAAADRSKIRQIEIELICETPEEMRGMWSISGKYIKSSWVKRFSPRNLQDI